jgi:5-methylcytosine-specific restriction endonuclease McrA
MRGKRKVCETCGGEHLGAAATCVRCREKCGCGRQKCVTAADCKHCAGLVVNWERVCVGCGVRFQKKRNRNKGLYCSRACAFANCPHWAIKPQKPKPPLPIRQCVVCGCFKRGANKTCSPDCHVELMAAKYAGRFNGPKPEPIALVCGCGRTFMGVSATICPRCRSVEQGRNNRERAKRAGVEYQPGVTFLRVAVRDGWRCQMCGVATPRSLRGTYEGNAPELDHIIPLSRGGGHTMGNVQCACRRCNGLKGAKLLSEIEIPTTPPTFARMRPETTLAAEVSLYEMGSF